MHYVHNPMITTSACVSHFCCHRTQVDPVVVLSLLSLACLIAYLAAPYVATQYGTQYVTASLIQSTARMS